MCGRAAILVVLGRVLLAVGVSVSASAGARQVAPAFDVASVRLNRDGGTSAARIQPQTGQFTATNMRLRDLILLAHNLHESQLAGGDPWIAADRFDIVARPVAPPAGGRDEVLQMLRALFAERFSLRTHVEQREMPVFLLTWARKDAQPGERLRPSSRDCASNPVPPVPNTAPLDRDGWPPCGLAFVRTVVGDLASRTQVRRSAISLRELATALQPAAGRPVLDRTGRSGLFDIEYEYAVDFPTAPAAQRGDGPDLFTALREQLGLRLDASLAPVDVLVIDAASRPSGD